MYDCMEPYAWLLITAVFCTRARSDSSWYYRTALLEICRKNYKTFYAGLIFILGMLIMGRFGRYFSVAPDLKLSKELQIAIRKIIKSSPALNDGTIFKLLRSEIRCLATDSEYTPLAYSKDKMDGKLANMFLADETGAMDNYPIEAMRSSQINMKNKLGIILSTQYPNDENALKDEIDIAKKTLDRVGAFAKNRRYFALLFEPDDYLLLDDLWQTDDRVIYQSNPVAVTSRTLFEALCEKRTLAVLYENMRENFLCKHCNIKYKGLGVEGYVDIMAVRQCCYTEDKISAIPNCRAIFKDYSFSVDGKIYPKSDFVKILRNSRGYGKGTGIVSESGTMLATAYNTILYENDLTFNGGNKSGVFTSQTQQTKEAMEAVKENWRKMNSNSRNKADKVFVLNAGMDFKEMSQTAMDMQLNQNKQTNSGEICGIFGVPSGMMSGNASSEAKENFITDVLTPLLNVFETAFDSDMLLEAEKGRRYFAFDTREFTRGDIFKRYQAYAIGKKNGFITIDDIRKQEDLTPINFPFIQLGLADVLYNPETEEIYTPNTNAVMNLKENGMKLFGRDGGNKGSEDIEEHAEELRYNPYHDPTNGRFTTSSGGGMGAVLHVPMGAKGKGEYVFSTNENTNPIAKERGVKNYKKNQVFHIAKPDGTFKEMDGDTFEFGDREFGVHEINGFTGGNLFVTDIKTGMRVGQYHTPKEAVSGIRKNINAIKSFKNLNAAESALDAYLYVKESKRAEELRFNPNHDPKNGKFTSGGGNSSKGLTSSGKNDIIKSTVQQRQDIKNILKGTKTPDGIIISNVSQHAADRIIERGYSADDIKKSLTNATVTYPGNTPGTHCIQFKSDDRIVYNDKGNVVTVVKLGKGGN